MPGESPGETMEPQKLVCSAAKGRTRDLVQVALGVQDSDLRLADVAERSRLDKDREGARLGKVAAEILCTGLCQAPLVGAGVEALEVRHQVRRLRRRGA